MDAALRDWNVNIPTGTLYGNKKSYNIKANGQLMKAFDYKPLIVTYRNGAPVRLEDVAHVIDSVEDDKNLSLIYGGEFGNGTRGVNLAVMRQPGSNTIEVTDAIKNAHSRRCAGQLPPSVNISVRGDRSKNIREAFQDIQFTMAATLVLVILVIFLFLRNVLGHHDSRHGAAVLDCRHLQRHVPAGLQHEQHLDDGADSLGRLRGGRRHRHAGEHRAPHRKGRAPADRRRSPVRARSASPSSR